MADNQVQPAVSTHVGGIGSHTRLELAIAPYGDARGVADLCKCTVPAVVKQRIGHGIVGYENVLPPVVMVVERHHAQAVCRLQCETGLLAYIGACTVSIVAIKRRPDGMIDVGMAVTPHPRLFVSAPEVLRRPVHIIRDHQV